MSFDMHQHVERERAFGKNPQRIDLDLRNPRLGMQERAAIFGGRVTITSRRLKGTIVRVRIPFAVTHRLPAASSHTDRR